MDGLFFKEPEQEILSNTEVLLKNSTNLFGSEMA